MKAKKPKDKLFLIKLVIIFFRPYGGIEFHHFLLESAEKNNPNNSVNPV